MEGDSSSSWQCHRRGSQLLAVVRPLKRAPKFSHFGAVVWPFPHDSQRLRRQTSTLSPVRAVASCCCDSRYDFYIQIRRAKAPRRGLAIAIRPYPIVVVLPKLAYRIRRRGGTEGRNRQAHGVSRKRAVLRACCSPGCAHMRFQFAHVTLADRETLVVFTDSVADVLSTNSREESRRVGGW